MSVFRVRRAKHIGTTYRMARLRDGASEMLVVIACIIMMHFFFASVFHFFASKCAFSPQPIFYPLFLNEDGRIVKKAALSILKRYKFD
jgi:hypothetical protein